MKFIKENILFILVAIMLIIVTQIYYSNQTDREENKKISIAKVNNYHIVHGTQHYLDFEFYYNGEKYLGSHRIDFMNQDKYLEHYYFVEFSSKNPNNNLLKIDKETTYQEYLKSKNGEE